MTTQFIQNLELHKYPRTAHLDGSRLQHGDAGHVPYAAIAGRPIVVEEKLDGGNTGVSFSPAAELLLQSRGHYLTGGGRERQFNLFKSWATAHEAPLLGVLEDRYIMYGEWLHKKHSVFYDRLPAYFNEFDIWDRSRRVFLSTDARRALLADAPVLPVPVLFRGTAPRKLADLMALIGPSLGKSPRWRSVFESVVEREGFDLGKAWKMADKSDRMEGLYIKVEEDGEVVDRLKLVRSDFVQAILEADQHHSTQPFIPNQLIEGVDIFAPRITVRWPGEAI